MVVVLGTGKQYRVFLSAMPESMIQDYAWIGINGLPDAYRAGSTDTAMLTRLTGTHGHTLLHGGVHVRERTHGIHSTHTRTHVRICGAPSGRLAVYPASLSQGFSVPGTHALTHAHTHARLPAPVFSGRRACPNTIGLWTTDSRWTTCQWMGRPLVRYPPAPSSPSRRTPAAAHCSLTHSLIAHCPWPLPKHLSDKAGPSL